MATAIIVLIVLFFLFCMATVLTETEHFGWATFTMIATLVCVQLLHVADLFAYVQHHVLTTILYVLGYLAAGLAWSFAKWFSFLMAFRDKFRQEKVSFLRWKKLDEDAEGQVPKEMRPAFLEYMRQTGAFDYRFRDNSLAEKPRASNNKARIISWMSLWPFSLTGTLLNDPVRRLFNWLFNSFKALYQKMADAIFANDVELK